jgi:hypothetical protein
MGLGDPSSTQGGRDQEGGIMTASSEEAASGRSTSEDLSQERKSRWPEPGSPRGAGLYAVIAGLIVWLLIGVLSHVQVYVSWR